VNIGGGFSVELMDKFRYLGDMLGVDGDADAALTDRICSGWFKFRSLVSFLTARDVPLKLCGKVYVRGAACCMGETC